MVLKTVDAHVAGAAVRWLTDGFAAPAGPTMKARAEWAAKHADHVRRALALEPRGHRDLVTVVLTEPAAEGTHAGVLFLSADGYEPMSGHGVMALAALAVGRDAIVLGGAVQSLQFDTPAGTFGLVLERADDATGLAARLRLGPSFPLHAGVSLTIGSRSVRGDVAFAGVFHLILDSESVGIPLDLAHLPELRRAAMAAAQAADAALIVKHPLQPQASRIENVVFTAPPRDERCAFRVAGVSRHGRVDWCPSVAGIGGVMSVLDAMGLIEDRAPLQWEGLVPETHCLSGCLGRAMVGELPAIDVEVKALCWTTGEHQFVCADDDPCRFGIQNIPLRFNP